jgi:hypothetical protein
MATHIDWNTHFSDGVANKYSGTLSTRVDKYISNLLSYLNDNPEILARFGKFKSKILF